MIQLRPFAKSTARENEPTLSLLAGNTIKLSKAGGERVGVEAGNYIWHAIDEGKVYVTRVPEKRGSKVGAKLTWSSNELKGFLMKLAQDAQPEVVTKDFQVKGGNQIIFTLSEEGQTSQTEEGDALNFFEVIFKEVVLGKEDEEAEQAEDEAPKAKGKSKKAAVVQD